MRPLRETELLLRFAALLRRLHGAALRIRRIERLARQHLLHADPRLQRRGGARLRLGALGGERLALALGLDTRLQCGGRFGLRLFTLPGDLDGVLAGLGPRQGAATKLVVERCALARRVERLLLRSGGLFSLPAQRFLRGGARLQLGGVHAVFRLGALPHGGGEDLLRRDARLRFGECAHLEFLAFARRLRGVALGLQPLLGAAAQLGVHRLALAREARRLGLDVGAHVCSVPGRLLRRGLHFRRLERLGFGIRALARLLLGRELHAAALLGQRRRALLRCDARVRLFQRARFGCLALLRRLDGRRLSVGTRLRAPRGIRVLSLALAHRRHGVALGGDPFLGGNARLLLGIGARTCRLRSPGFQPAALVGKLLRLLLGLAARLLLLEVRALDVAALVCQAPRFGLRCGARLGIALELVLAGLALSCRLERSLLRQQALARHVQPALLLAQLRLHRLAGAALGLDAVALRPGALAVGVLQLVEQLAHLLALAMALSLAAVLPRAGEKSRLIMSPRASE